jgi:hypothetical protein
MAKEKKNHPLFNIEDFDDIVDSGGPNFNGIEVYAPNTPGGAPMFDGLDECAPREPGPNKKLIDPLIEDNPQVRELGLGDVERPLDVGGFELLSSAEEAALDFDKFFEKQAGYLGRYYDAADFDNADIVDSLKYYISRKLLELEMQYDVSMADIWKEWRNQLGHKKQQGVVLPKNWPFKATTRTPEIYTYIFKGIIESPNPYNALGETFIQAWNNATDEEKKEMARGVHLKVKERMDKLRLGLKNITGEIIKITLERNPDMERKKGWSKYRQFHKMRKRWKTQASVYKQTQWTKGRAVNPKRYKRCNKGGGGWIFIPIVFGIHLFGSEDIGEAMELTAEDLINDLMDPLNIDSITGELDPGSEINWDNLGDDEYFFKTDGLIRGFADGDIDYSAFEQALIDLQTDAMINEFKSQKDPDFSEYETLRERVREYIQTANGQNGLSTQETQTDLQNFAFRQRISQGSTWDALNTNAGISSCSSFDYTGWLNPPIDSEKVVIDCGGEEPTPTPTPTQFVVTPTPTVTPETPVPTPTATSGGSTPTPSLP